MDDKRLDDLKIQCQTPPFLLLGSDGLKLIEEVRRLKAETTIKDRRIAELDEWCREWKVRYEGAIKVVRETL